MPYTREFKYSMPGMVLGGIVGAPLGTVLGYLIWRGVPDTPENIIEFIGILAIPTFLAAGSAFGAYVGGRIFGRYKNNSL